MVASVESGSIGEESGLKAGDVILEINRKSTTKLKDFTRVVSEIKKGEGVLLLVYREGMTIFVTISPGK